MDLLDLTIYLLHLLFKSILQYDVFQKEPDCGEFNSKLAEYTNVLYSTAWNWSNVHDILNAAHKKKYKIENFLACFKFLLDLDNEIDGKGWLKKTLDNDRPVTYDFVSIN